MLFLVNKIEGKSARILFICRELKVEEIIIEVSERNSGYLIKFPQSFCIDEFPIHLLFN